jgi:hypothetical protein
MDLTLYMIFSILETSAMFYLMFKVFKIDLFPGQILFASAIMAFTSYTLRTFYEQPVIDIFVQNLLMLCFVWMLFRIHIFYAVIITGMTYHTYSIIQFSYYSLLDKMGFFNSSIPYILNTSTFALQSISALTAILIGWLVYNKRKGFDFIPDKPSGRIRLNPRDKVLFAISLPSSFIFTFTVYFTVFLQKPIYMVIIFIYVFILFAYLYFSYKKDRREDEHFSV